MASNVIPYTTSPCCVFNYAYSDLDFSTQEKYRTDCYLGKQISKAQSHSNNKIPIIYPYTAICQQDNDNRRNIYTASYCCCSVTKLCSTLWDPKDCNTPASSITRSLFQFMSVMLSNQLILCFVAKAAGGSIWNSDNHETKHRRK